MMKIDEGNIALRKLSDGCVCFLLHTINSIEVKIPTYNRRNRLPVKYNLVEDQQGNYLSVFIDN